MILIYAIAIILIEAVTEGLLKRLNSPINEIIFDAWIQWVIALMFFGSWFIWAIHFDGYFVPVAKMIIGFVFVRFAPSCVTGILQVWKSFCTTTFI